MMSIIKIISPEWALRLGFGVMYLYSGIDLIRHPTAWHWALPLWLKNIIASVLNLNTYLALQGTLEIFFAVAFLGWFMPRYLVKFVALLSALEMAVILLLALIPFSAANFLITFRDLGLLGGALALLAIILKKDR